MNTVRESIINQGVTPIISLEGSKYLIDEYIKSIIEGRTYNTRKIELSSYKKPIDSSSITKEQSEDYTFRIVMQLINKLRKLCALNGNEIVYDNLPNVYKLNYSFEQFIQIFTLSNEKISEDIKKYNGNPKENFLNMLIDNAILYEDRIGKINCIPYGNDIPHKKDADYRIYINTPNGLSRYDFLEKFITKCIDRNIPYEMKGEENTGDEKDRTCIYCFDEYFDETIEVLEEIRSENRELISEFGSPIATGINYSYYAITTSRQGATYNYWFNRISSHAINYLCANLIKLDNHYYSNLSDEEKNQIELISNINNYSFDKEGRFDIASNSIVNDYIVKKKEKMMQPEICQKLMEVLTMMCSLANFGDLEHNNSTISLDLDFYNHSKLTTQNKKEESINNLNEKEMYLYHTEDLINNVLDLYQQGDISFEQLMNNYIERISFIYKKYKYYALHELGFITSSRNIEISEIFKKIFTGIEKPNNDSKIDTLEYYQCIQMEVNTYLNEKLKK